MRTRILGSQLRPWCAARPTLRSVTQPGYIKYTSIELVHPPISSQEAVWYEQAGDAELEEVLRGSKLYLIGGRPDARFVNFDFETDVLEFDLVVGGQVVCRNRVDVYALEHVQNRSTETVDVELGDKAIRIWEHGSEEKEALLDWFTVDKLMLDASRGFPGLEGVVTAAELITFDLLYVGIATETDSFDRLIQRGHKAKAEILANEPQRFPGARVADEIYFFLMRADPLFIRMIDENWKPDPGPSDGQIVADLEKALVSQLGPKYNRIRYKRYPAGKDGLSGSLLDRYGYGIAENLVFRTAMGEFRGRRDAQTGLAAGDLIFVDESGVAVLADG